MGYYMRGDYYRGDYYRGDPFLGALVGTVARKVGLGKVASKAARWVGQRISGRSLKRAAGIVGAATVGVPVLRSSGWPQPATDDMPIELGPLGIDPGAILPGGRKFLTLGGGKTYRRMNPLNPRALKRALRRAEGFEKFARSTMTALYKPGGGRKFKKASRRK